MVNRIVAFLVSAYYVIIGWLMPSVYDYEVIENVRYAEAECAVMDVYLPESAVDREENGCVIMIHGGAWSGGDKGDERARCYRLARRGYVVASINYTLYAEGQGYTVDTVLDEIDTAIAALRDMSAVKSRGKCEMLFGDDEALSELSKRFGMIALLKAEKTVCELLEKLGKNVAVANVRAEASIKLWRAFTE